MAAAREALLEIDSAGLHCPAAGFHIDPWAPVERAVITHPHPGRARPGARSYLAAAGAEALVRTLTGEDAHIETLPYGETVRWGGVSLSFHPAGHLLGSAQVRVERAGEVWVVSGDYSLQPDPTCAPFEPLPCHTFLTEATYGLPVFRWRPAGEVIAEIHAWWRGNQEAGRASLLFAGAMGKAQRILAALDPAAGPIYTHAAIERINALYRAADVALAPTIPVESAARSSEWRRALILAPPSELSGPWIRRFGSASRALASGWMRIRGARRRRTLDRGFVLSAHPDWPALNRAIAATGAGRILVTHGIRAPLARWLAEKGLDAEPLETRYDDSGEDE